MTSITIRPAVSPRPAFIHLSNQRSRNRQPDYARQLTSGWQFTGAVLLPQCPRQHCAIDRHQPGVPRHSLTRCLGDDWQSGLIVGIAGSTSGRSGNQTPLPVRVRTSALRAQCATRQHLPTRVNGRNNPQTRPVSHSTGGVTHGTTG